MEKGPLRKTKIAILSARNDIHTVRWVNGLIERGYEVHLFTMHSGGDPLHQEATVYHLPWQPPLGYFASGIRLRQMLSDLNPDMLHTHFASGYGLLGRLSGYHPHVLSVWGQDIYEFPNRSKIHRHVLQKNLDQADVICSTSQALARETHEICPTLDPIYITPFGVDTNKFSPQAGSNAQRSDHSFVVGTVKNLEEKYGIDRLIEMFAILYKKLTKTNRKLAENLRLLIVGGGPERGAYEQLAQHRGISDRTTFVGNVPHDEVPSYLGEIDVYVALSRYESFGVAVIEASACECPVVVSDVGGLPEVVRDGKTGFVVPGENRKKAAQAVEKILTNLDLMIKMGEAGRRFVAATYSWSRSLDKMEIVYDRILDSNQKLSRSQNKDRGVVLV